MASSRRSVYFKLVLLYSVGVVSLSACAPGPSVQPALPHTLSGTSASTVQPGELSGDRAAVLIVSLENASKKDVASTLLHKWLEYQETGEVGESLRLTNYRIEYVIVLGYCPPPNKDTTMFAAQVEFSVQTLSFHPGDWAAFPNATLGDGHWLYHLSPYAGISAAKGIYTFGLETFPCDHV